MRHKAQFTTESQFTRRQAQFISARLRRAEGSGASEAIFAAVIEKRAGMCYH